MFTGFATAPAQGTASRNSWYRSLLNARMPTRSPCRTPSARNAPANRATRSADSATVRVRSAQMVTRRSGSCWSARCRNWVRYIEHHRFVNVGTCDDGYIVCQLLLVVKLSGVLSEHAFGGV